MTTKTEDPAATRAPASQGPQVRADADTQAKVLAAIRTAGKTGASLRELEAATKIRYRVLHNVTWHLEGRPVRGTTRRGDKVQARRLPGNSVRYVVAGR